MPDRSERWLLNRLIAMCRDEELTLRYVADHVKAPEAKAFILDLASRRSQFASDLTPHAQRLGGFDAADGTTRGTLHRRWMAIRHALTGVTTPPWPGKSSSARTRPPRSMTTHSRRCYRQRRATWSRPSGPRSGLRTSAPSARSCTDEMAAASVGNLCHRRTGSKSAEVEVTMRVHIPGKCPSQHLQQIVDTTERPPPGRRGRGQGEGFAVPRTAASRRGLPAPGAAWYPPRVHRRPHANPG